MCVCGGGGGGGGGATKGKIKSVLERCGEGTSCYFL